MGTESLEPLEVVTLGEALVALVAADTGPLREATTFQRHIVGAESNLAVGLARLGHRSAFLSRVGGDAFGQAVLGRLRGEGVDVSGVTVDPEGFTGVLFRERRGIGPSEVFYQRAGSAASRLDSVDVLREKSLIAQARWLHITGITPALSPECSAAVATAIEIARDFEVQISLDLNIRRKLWAPEQAVPALLALVASCDLVLAGEDEAQLVTGQPDLDAAARDLLAAGPSLVVIKQAAAGATSYRAGEPARHRPAIPVDRPIDAVGAGDAFAAGFLAGLLEDLDPDACLDLGNACGAFAVASEGDITGLPSRAEAARAAQGTGKVLR